MTYPGVIFWLLVFWATFARGPVIYYLLFGCMSLGTLAVLPPQLSIGNLTPPWICMCFLTIRVVMEQGLQPYFAALLDFRRFGFLTLCTIYGVASAFFLPRLFAGQVQVIEMRLLETNAATPLHPGGANVSQALYFLITTLAVVNVYLICRDPERRRTFLQAFGFGAAVAVATGIVDLFASRTGLSALLAPFRNATYTLMTDNDAMSMHRVVGLMSEASAYAALCLPFLSLMALTPGWASPWGRWRGPLCLALALMTFLSTSSGGYVALGAVAAVFMVCVGLAMLEGWKSAWWVGLAILLCVSATALVVMAKPDIFAPAYHIFDVMVLHKTSTSSYIERSNWNRVSFLAFVNSHYLGVGVGSSRASSWIVALLSNVGVPGTGLLAIFLGQVFFARGPTPAEHLFARAIKLALLPAFLIISLSGTSVGFGLQAATLIGLITGLCWPTVERARTFAGRPLEASAAAAQRASVGLAGRG